MCRMSPILNMGLFSNAFERGFYRSANAILRIKGRSNELVMLQLLEFHCQPILTYAIEAIEIADRDTRRKLRVAYNSIFRQIFCNRMSESDLQHQLHRSTWEELIEKRKTTFRVSLSYCAIANEMA